MTKYIEQMVYSGSCEDCFAVHYVAPHPESSDHTVERIANGLEAWDSFTSCFVCEGEIDWNGNDPVEEVFKW